MSGKNYEYLSTWANRTKERMLQSLGGSCGICGYNKCKGALCFHHINPDEKEFILGGIRGCSMSWNRIVKELRKCVILCANCHSEVHNGMTILPENIKRFDESYATYKPALITFTTRDGLVFTKYENNIKKCHVCGGLMPSKGQKTCSITCDKEQKTKTHWYGTLTTNELSILLSNNSLEAIGRMFGVAGNTIKKRCKKLNLL